MSSAQEKTGRFWLCPKCRKHVSIRDDRCVCGFDRTAVPTQIWEVSTRPGTVAGQPGRSAFDELWPFVIIAALATWLAYEKLRRPEVGVTPAAVMSPARAEPASGPSEPPTSAVVGSYAFARVPEPREPWTPPSQPPQQVRTAPKQMEQQQPTEQPTADPRTIETQWRLEGLKRKAQLVQAHDAYRAALCTEALGGVPIAEIKTQLEFRGEYVMARAEAEAFLEGARLAGVNPNRLDISMADFPQPAPVSDLVNQNLSAWRCRQ